MRVIEAFNRERKQMTLADAAKAVDLPRASVRRTLMTLALTGKVDPYKAGFGPFPAEVFHVEQTHGLRWSPFHVEPVTGPRRPGYK